MANITVSYSDVEQAAADLERGRQEITEQLQRMSQRIDTLLASGFVTDRASVKFGEAYAEYTAHASAVAQRLSEIQGYLTQAAHAIRDMDEQMAARIS